MNKPVENRIKSSHILPFFWMHGAEPSDTLQLLEAVYNSGIREICLESRPHPDFAGPLWWRDVDLILQEAQKRGMRVWILDDSHFPTGYANGAAKEVPRHLKRLCLTEKHYEIKGPVRGIKVDVGRNLNIHPQTREREDAYYQEEIEAVLLAELETADEKELSPAAVSLQQIRMPVCRKIRAVRNITDQTENGWLYLDLPEGEYRVYVLTTKLHASMMLADGISLLERDSVRLLIDEVYEAHYQHYASYFGNTLAGFFSDEPGFFNLADRGYGYAARTGEESVPLPWSDGVYEELKETFGERTDSLLPFLFGACSVRKEEEKEIRVRYMELVSQKYEENFSGQLGEWCRDHKVAYIGHIVEDDPGYERLGMSAAHYFRAVRGQDMAGIDVVLGDLMPDENEGRGAFYHYGLAQLAGSLAAQTPHQKGRALCEVFGAYGWAEGVTLMKWMADHMLSGGINYFVPHAFTDKAFPDPDCPPHFWARGKNPQYPFMEVLFRYMERMARLFDGGKPLVQNAVLFEAEEDWAGETQPYYALGKALLTHQVPYHLVCLDDLKKSSVEKGQLVIGEMRYDRLFIGQADCMNQETVRLLQRRREEGAELFFVGKRPKAYNGSTWKELECILSIDQEEMQKLAKKTAALEVRTEGTEKKASDLLRCYSYRRQEMDVHMLLSSSVRDTILAEVVFKNSGETSEIYRYDAMEQKIHRVEIQETEAGKKKLSLKLEPLEALVFLEDNSGSLYGEPEPVFQNAVQYKGGYRIRRAAYDQPEQWNDCGETEELYDIARKYPDFAGKISYELEFENQDFTDIRLKGAAEGIEVFCDGESLGKKIAFPYQFKLPEGLREGNHVLRLEVSTTLVNAVPDLISCKRPIAPTGFLGELYFLQRKNERR